MNSVRFFWKELPVVGDAPVIDFDDGPHKVWQLVLVEPDGEESYVPMREKIGEVSLQERFDHYVWHEANQTGDGRMLWRAERFEPAYEHVVSHWLSGHKKRRIQ